MGALWQHARALRARAGAGARRSRPDAARVAALLARARPGEVLPEPECRELVALYGIPVPDWRMATSATETVEAVEALTAPAALKLVARGVVHKSDVGGVRLGIRGPEAARDGWAHLMDAAARAGATDARVLVTPMLDPGVEALVDVVFRVAPFGAGEAEAMIAEIHGHRLFGAVRGRPAVDRASLVDLLVRVSELASDRPDLAELDLNPVICSARGAAIADARAVVG